VYVVLNIDANMLAWTVAGIPCAARMRRVLEPLGEIVDRVPEPARPDAFRLLVQGIFPLLEGDAVARFLDFARREGGAVWPAAGGDMGLALVSATTAEADFATLCASLPAWSPGSAPAPLRSAADLARFNAFVFERTAAAAMAAGAVLLAPSQTWIEEAVRIAAGAVIEANVYLGGESTIAAGARIQIGVHLRDSRVAEGACIRAYSVVEGSTIGVAAMVGPFAHVRPGSDLGRDVRVGNFVETKKVKLGAGSKASHLAYLGDADIGRDCNIGAGTITCNYDGYNKWTTQLGDRVFIGSDSQLVAPVCFGYVSYIAEGSTITGDVPADAMSFALARQFNNVGMAEKLRQRARKKQV